MSARALQPACMARPQCRHGNADRTYDGRCRICDRERKRQRRASEVRVPGPNGTTRTLGEAVRRVEALDRREARRLAEADRRLRGPIVPLADMSVEEDGVARPQTGGRRRQGASSPRAAVPACACSLCLQLDPDRFQRQTRPTRVRVEAPAANVLPLPTAASVEASINATPPADEDAA